MEEVLHIIVLELRQHFHAVARGNLSITDPRGLVRYKNNSVLQSNRLLSDRDVIMNGKAMAVLAALTVTACGGGSSGPTMFGVGGSVSGLASGTSVVLLDNSANSTTVSANTTFTFSTTMTAGSSYSVTIGTQPSGQTCVVSSGSGSIGSADITSVKVTCAPTTYSIGGTVTGLASYETMVLLNNGGDSVTVGASEQFTFPTPIASGGAYAVTIGKQPEYQGCSVVVGSGTVAEANITSVEIHCPLVTQIRSLGLGADGNFPQSGLITGNDGTLYGTTEYGGSSVYGTIYSLAPSGAETIIANFAGTPSAGSPMGATLPTADGSFYGTTYSGGANNLGTVYKVGADDSIATLWSFGSNLDGELPKGALVQLNDGNFYGTTSSGGQYGWGTVFRVTPAGAETVLWSFGNGTDGVDPEGGLVAGSDGNLYGTTSLGGTNNIGTVFRITPAGVETVLWNFASASGGLAVAPMTLGRDGNFYGTTQTGGPNGGGTLFKITSAGALTTVWGFGAGTDGAMPSSGVIEASDGNFYGTTSLGGTIQSCGGGEDPYGCGTIFKVTPSGVETVLWDFGFGGNGASPDPLSLAEGPDGNFYGVTRGSGTAGDGTLYRLTP